jgi:hypothetical protein
MATCPVCDCDQLDEEPWKDGVGSQEICPLCGLQFGYDDACGGDQNRRPEFYEQRRAEWFARGSTAP